MKLDEVLCEECGYEEVFIDGDENVYDDQQNHLGTTDQFELDEDWGSSDWTAALNMLKQELNAGAALPDALMNVAEHYNPGRQYEDDEWEYFSPERLFDMAIRRGVITKSGQVNEASVRQWKRFGTNIRKRYRCTSGPKKGKLVSEPSRCATRKDPKKVRQGRKLMRTKKNTIARKSRISKRKQVSKMVTRMNKRLRGEKSGGTMTGGKDKK